MANTYVWQFERLDVFNTYQTVTDAVESMHWRLTADDGLGHTAQAYGEVKAGPVDVENFILFDELTLETVQGWCEVAMGADEVNAIKAFLARQIDEQVSPTVLPMPPPWL